MCSRAAKDLDDSADDMIALIPGFQEHPNAGYIMPDGIEIICLCIRFGKVVFIEKFARVETGSGEILMAQRDFFLDIDALVGVPADALVLQKLFACFERDRVIRSGEVQTNAFFIQVFRLKGLLQERRKLL